ncbi:choline dehydrogenase [Tistlia consotensis]|uniref:Choline dehydrogenase n=1 Tax=Tistlia consotensis USBA 355 TaxID=560819 RepID=A0A1Y6CGE1_9PROT|nr:choline dehydrogenase [Tistlia consotensis]SMF53792.1 choline dehydrogenase [Tistlia consotensis USBA 355]SNR86023.1 choline dehydrogenase [Tistlia consotensis]
MSDKVYDYVIVGAGSAGCVLAARLTEDPQVSVLLLEAGGPDKGLMSWQIHMPLAFAEPLKGTRYNWAFESEPEPFMDNRRIIQPRGKVLGGSSSINGMAYVRGHARDYDRWAQSGLSNWSYADCLPYFRRAQSHEFGADEYRGDSGPLKVSAGDVTTPLSKAWIEAGRQAGYFITEDMNGYRQEGIGRMDQTSWKGERWSAAKGYLRPAMARPNLTVVTRAQSRRIVFEGRRAVGVDYVADGRQQVARAGREVILSGGAIGSPHLLLLSGVGPADQLRDLGIEVVAELPGVGENLQDHLEIYVQYAATQPVSLYPLLKPWNKLRVGAEWLFLRRGPGTSNQFEVGGFIRSRAGIEHPNLQYHFLPIAITYAGTAPAAGHGFQAHVGPMRPTSRGRLWLDSADWRQAPRFVFNYNETENDRQEMRDAVRLTREIFRQKAFDGLRGEELAPGPRAQSDAEIDAFVREHGESAYHPSCTCKMGPAGDSMAVVDGEGRVHGLEGLRVVDASIMPSIPSGNLNAPTIMLAEKLSDAIRGKASLPRSEAPVWIHPDWETQQR